MFSMKRGALLVLLFYTGLLPFIPIKESFLEIMLPVTMIRYTKMCPDLVERFFNPRMFKEKGGGCPPPLGCFRVLDHLL